MKSLLDILTEAQSSLLTDADNVFDTARRSFMNSDNMMDLADIARASSEKEKEDHYVVINGIKAVMKNLKSSNGHNFEFEIDKEAFMKLNGSYDLKKYKYIDIECILSPDIELEHDVNRFDYATIEFPVVRISEYDRETYNFKVVFQPDYTLQMYKDNPCKVDGLESITVSQILNGIVHCFDNRMSFTSKHLCNYLKKLYKSWIRNRMLTQILNNSRVIYDMFEDTEYIKTVIDIDSIQVGLYHCRYVLSIRDDNRDFHEYKCDDVTPQQIIDLKDGYVGTCTGITTTKITPVIIGEGRALMEVQNTIYIAVI